MGCMMIARTSKLGIIALFLGVENGVCCSWYFVVDNHLMNNQVEREMFVNVNWTDIGPAFDISYHVEELIAYVNVPINLQLDN